MYLFISNRTPVFGRKWCGTGEIEGDKGSNGGKYQQDTENA